MNVTPAPIFNARKRPRQAMIADPQMDHRPSGPSGATQQYTGPSGATQQYPGPTGAAQQYSDLMPPGGFVNRGHPNRNMPSSGRGDATFNNNQNNAYGHGRGNYSNSVGNYSGGNNNYSNHAGNNASYSNTRNNNTTGTGQLGSRYNSGVQTQTRDARSSSFTQSSHVQEGQKRYTYQNQTGNASTSSSRERGNFTNTGYNGATNQRMNNNSLSGPQVQAKVQTQSNQQRYTNQSFQPQTSTRGRGTSSQRGVALTTRNYDNSSNIPSGNNGNWNRSLNQQGSFNPGNSGSYRGKNNEPYRGASHEPRNKFTSNRSNDNFGGSNQQLIDNFTASDLDGSFDNTQLADTATQKTNKPSDKKTSPLTELLKSMHVLTMHVTDIRRWNKYKDHVQMMFELFGVFFYLQGCLDSAITRSNGFKEFLLRDDQKNQLKCIFFEIDRQMPKMTRGQWYRVIGTYDQRNDRLKCLSFRQIVEAEKPLISVLTTQSGSSISNITRGVREQ